MPLHSTMFLLIRSRMISVIYDYLSLHSTMFLLIRGADYLNLNNSAFTFHYVSINTPDPLLLQLLKTSFTFHYVSINTASFRILCLSIQTLHSTMFLLIRSVCGRIYQRDSLYIPLCFY